MLINNKEWRSHKVLNRFMGLLNQYDFLVTQDEDYLNLICKDHVLFLDQKWNYETMFELPCLENEVGVFHYIMFEKPWHYSCDMSKFIAYIIDTLNHDSSISDLLIPSERIWKIVKRYNEKKK